MTEVKATDLRPVMVITFPLSVTGLGSDMRCNLTEEM